MLRKILQLSLCLSLITACGPAPNETDEPAESSPVPTATPRPTATPAETPASEDPAPEASAEVEPEIVSIRVENLPEQISPGDSVEPKALVVYDDGSEKEGVTFFSSNSDILLKEGNFLKGQRPGTSTVTFQSRRKPEIKTEVQVTVGEVETLGPGQIYPSLEANTPPANVLNSFLGQHKPGTELEYTMRFAGASLTNVTPELSLISPIYLSQGYSISNALDEADFQKRVQGLIVVPNQEIARYIIRVTEAVDDGHRIEVKIETEGRPRGNITPRSGEYFPFNYAELFDGFLEQKSNDFKYFLSQTAQDREVESYYPTPGSSLTVQEYTTQSVTAGQDSATELVQYLLHKDLGVVKKTIQMTRAYPQAHIHSQVELELTGYKSP